MVVYVSVAKLVVVPRSDINQRCHLEQKLTQVKQYKMQLP